MINKGLVFIIIIILAALLTGCAPASTSLPTSTPTAKPSATATPTNTPEPTLTPTPQPYYLEGSTLYSLYGGNGGYMVVGEDIASLETSPDGILTAYDAEGTPRFELVDGEWVDVVIEWEYVILAATDEERTVLEGFTANFLTEYEEEHGEPFDFESIPEERRIHLRNVGEEEDLGPMEFGYLNDIWIDVDPEYSERYRSLSVAVVGVTHIPDPDGGLDRIVVFTPARNNKVLVNVLDMNRSRIGMQANMYAAEYVPVDLDPIFNTDGGFTGEVEDTEYISIVKKYFAEGGEPFQAFVYYSAEYEGATAEIKAMWEDLKDFFSGNLTFLQDDYGISMVKDFFIRGIAISDEVAAEMGWEGRVNWALETQG